MKRSVVPTARSASQATSRTRTVWLFPVYERFVWVRGHTKKLWDLIDVHTQTQLPHTTEAAIPSHDRNTTEHRNTAMIKQREKRTRFLGPGFRKLIYISWDCEGPLSQHTSRAERIGTWLVGVPTQH